jgi:hypothetical protein
VIKNIPGVDNGISVYGIGLIHYCMEALTSVEIFSTLCFLMTAAMSITDVGVADKQESRRVVIGRTEVSYCQILRTVELVVSTPAL